MRRSVAVLFLALAAPAPASAAITLGATPATPVYGTHVTLAGTTNPNEPLQLFVNGNLLGGVTAGSAGAYAFVLPATIPGSYEVRSASETSPTVPLAIKPIVTKRVVGLRYPGGSPLLKGRLEPANAGTLSLKVGLRTWSVKQLADGHYRVRLPTNRIGLRTARLLLAPSTGYVPLTVRKDFRILSPSLSTGASGNAVLALERRLAQLRYALRGVNRYYSYDTYEAVLAFQKVQGISRTGSVTKALWARLAAAHIPHARVTRGDHIEVSKTKQVLYEVRAGKVVRVVHVSTGATGNTPVGTWHVYGKVPGLNSHGMYYSLFWLRGFAIHGYASVPPWPASHGCVRTPMWFAPGFYSRWPVGATVRVFA